MTVCGYSTDYSPNKDYQEQGLFCEWEHCIEQMPLLHERPHPLSCPVFGHCCPGGVMQVKECGNKGIADMPEERFASPDKARAWLEESGF